MDKSRSNKNEKTAFNYCEVPESIFVETRFITLSAARQKRNEQLFYLIDKNGQLELSRNENQFIAFKNFKNMAKPKPITVSLQPRPATTASVQKSLLPAVTPPPLQSIRPVSLTKFSNNLLNANVAINTAPLPRVTAIPIATANSLQEINNAAVVISTPKPSELSTCAPTRSLNDRMQQTEISGFNMKSVAIQCDIMEESADSLTELPVMQEDSSDQDGQSGKVEITKETFLKFVKDNSTQYKNCHRECLICGEVSKSIKSFYAHMGIHQGPKVLCFKCGFYLDNEDLFRKHKCFKLKIVNKIHLNCPHYGCNVVGISKLELYDHMNEHKGHRPYKCTGCQKAFLTRQEFLRHILIRAKCFTQVKRKRYCIYNLERQRDRLCRVRVFTLHSFKKRTILGRKCLPQKSINRGKCKICLKYFISRGIFERHRIKCLLKFRKRLTRKRYGTKTI